MQIPDDASPAAGASPAPNAFAAVLSEAVAAQRLTLDRLQAKLRQAGTPVSAATLSYWQTGRSMPTRRRSLRAIEELERILQVPQGHLVDSLPTDFFAPRGGDQLMPANELATQMMAELDLDLGRHFTGVVDITRTVIAADRTEHSQLTQQVLRSNENGWHRLPLVLRQDADEDCVPELVNTSGCRVGRVLTSASAHLLVAELVLPRPFARNELAHISYDVRWAPNSQPSFRTERVLLNRHQSLTLAVTFLATPPRRAEHYRLDSYDKSHEEYPAMERTAGDQVEVTDQELQVVLADAEPGVHGLTWSW